MPGVLKTDCRVKPEVKSFNRLGPTSRVALSEFFNPLFEGLYELAGGNQNHPWRHDPPEHTALFSRGARFAS